MKNHYKCGRSTQEKRNRAQDSCRLRYLMTLFVVLSVGGFLNAQTLNTTVGSTGYDGMNGSGPNTAITFVIDNTSAESIVMTDVGDWTDNSFNGEVFSLYYSSSSLSGMPPLTFPATDWTLVDQNTVTSITSTILSVNNVISNMGLIIPANTTYRFALFTTGNRHYSGYGPGSCTPNTFSNSGVNLNVGDYQISSEYVGYGSANNPRFFTGSVTFMPASTCVGQPSAGTIPATFATCPSTGFNITATGATLALNMANQWQSRNPVGTGVWTNIAGANSTTYNSAGITSSTDYRYITKCTTSGLSDTSTIMTTTVKPVAECYCTPIFIAGCDDDQVKDFFISGENGTSISDISTGCSPGAYDDKTALSPVDLNAGGIYSAFISTNYDEDDYAVIWIDFNNDGQFDEFISASQPLPISEKVAVYASYLSITSPGSEVILEIPLQAPGGLARMRVMVGYDGWNQNPSSFLPCNSDGYVEYGEVHDYMVNIIGSPLAITLGNLSAENQGKVNVLDWNTLKEAEGDRFEIERSTDGRNFEVIAQLEAKGEPSTYRFVDEKPYSGVNYYRLGFLNIDAAKENSKIVKSTVKGGDFTIKAYPNPTSDVVKIQVLGNIVGKAVITISDATGKVVKIIDMTESGIDLSMSNLASGLYIIKYQDDVQNAVLKVTKD